MKLKQTFDVVDIKHYTFCEFLHIKVNINK